MIIIAGHSHIVALTDGVPLRPNQSTPKLLPVRDTRHPIFGLHGPWPRTEEYWRALTDHASENSVALLWEGNQHNVFFLIEQVPRFDFIARGLEDMPLDEDALVVPEALIRAKFRSRLKPLDDVLRALKGCQCQIALLGTPPPKRDNESLRNLLSYEVAYYYNPANLPVDHLRLTSPAIRLKLWHVLQDIYREQADAYGVEFIPVPMNKVADEAGFLKPEFDAGDVTHANAAYGRVFLDHLDYEFKSRFA